VNKNDLRTYIAVTGAYWGFTVTDGALRMLVLLHFNTMGFSPLDLAYLFLLYEATGIFSNFFGGWIGSRFGLRVTLFAGLITQICALILLSVVQPDWLASFSIIYVMLVQALSGVAKDLTKMSSKSAVKFVIDEEDQGLLFKWIAILTGSKNAMKGLGFFLGGILLQFMGFDVSLWLMSALLAVILVIAYGFVKADLGKATKEITRRDLFAKSREINFLSAARIFLFASRDVWFVVGVPVFLYSQLDWSFNQVGVFLATWVIFYGIVQAMVPRIFSGVTNTRARAINAKYYGMLLAFIPLGIAIGMSPDILYMGGGEGVKKFILVGGLFLFGIVFAINSSIHSFLIVAYSDSDKVVLNIGFYYMANALGRLVGTLLSGLVFQYFGLSACLFVSTIMVCLAVLLTRPLEKELPLTDQVA
jgi:predicted MFS family arabinose efflux permease